MVEHKADVFGGMEPGIVGERGLLIELIGESLYGLPPAFSVLLVLFICLTLPVVDETGAEDLKDTVASSRRCG